MRAVEAISDRSMWRVCVLQCFHELLDSVVCTKKKN